MAETALFISIISALVAVYAAVIAQKALKDAQSHNRLMVNPNLIIESAFVSSEKMLLQVRNGGLGPAKI